METLNEVTKAGHEHRPIHTVLQDTVPTGSDQEQLH